MPWYRLRSGTLWWGRDAPAGGVAVDDDTVAGQHGSDGLVDAPGESPVLGADLPVQVEAQGGEPGEVAPRVTPVAEDPHAPVDELDALTVSELRSHLEVLGVPASDELDKAGLIRLLVAHGEQR